MKFLAIIEGTLREGLAKKTILGMFIVSTLVILIALFIFQMDVVKHGLLSPAADHVKNGKGQQPTSLIGMTMLDFVWTGTSAFLMFISVFVGTFATAGFITSMMEKGNIDLLLSKPVPRWQYVVGRFTGAVIIIALEVAYLVIGLWFLAGVSLGSWSASFLWCIPLITLTFAAVYALVTLIGVMTRSSWFAIIIGLTLYILGSVVVPLAMFINRLLTGDDSTGVVAVVGKVFHYALPQASEMGKTMTNILVGQSADVAPIFITLGLALAYLSLSSWSFSKKEF